uniref:hypothetical protein n=1 Tax=Streptomyces gossypiisoli TaxID=2748864 RepID=UPI0015DAEC65|nr:hypothetical protein [Streptomyces gossypiisoli]
MQFDDDARLDTSEVRDVRGSRIPAEERPSAAASPVCRRCSSGWGFCAGQVALSVAGARMNDAGGSGRRIRLRIQQSTCESTSAPVNPLNPPATSD